MSSGRESGAPRPALDYEPGGIWIKFPFSTAYLAKTSNGPDVKKSSGKTEDKIIAIARKSPSDSIPKMGEILGISTRRGKTNSPDVVFSLTLRILLQDACLVDASSKIFIGVISM